MPNYIRTRVVVHIHRYILWFRRTYHDETRRSAERSGIFVSAESPPRQVASRDSTYDQWKRRIAASIGFQDTIVALRCVKRNWLRASVDAPRHAAQFCRPYFLSCAFSGEFSDYLTRLWTSLVAWGVCWSAMCSTCVIRMVLCFLLSVLRFCKL